jgi:oleandomycin transport system ATP-binding protein
VWATIRRLVDEGATVLLTTQYLEEADALADSIVVFDHGRIVAEGTPAELKAQTGRQSLDVRPADPANLDKVEVILAQVVGSMPSTDADRGLVSVAVRDGSVMPVVVRRLDDAGIAVTELSVRLPSLDEVFLGLTGHAALTQEEVPA